MSKEREAYSQRTAEPTMGASGPPSGISSAGYDNPIYPGQASFPSQASYEGPAAYPTYNTIPGPNGNVAYPPVITRHKKSVFEAYLLWFVFGPLGFHHFYLNRPAFGVLYFLTFGLCGCGYLIDMFRMPYLVSEANKCQDNPSLGYKKNVSDAYTLWFPFGLLGFHHFYLGKPLIGLVYFFTCGYFGIGWLIDLCRIPSLVKQANERTPEELQKKQVGTTYCIGLSPLGFLGIHHFYLHRPLSGLYYLFTFGGLGFGWLVDWCRIPILVKRANKDMLEGPDNERHLDAAFVAWMPFGIFGLHHYYLNRPLWGILYTFSFGLAGIGWLVDGFRLSCLVNECNRQLQEFCTLSSYSGPRQGYVIPPHPNGPVSGMPPSTTDGTGLYPTQQQYQQQHYPPQQYQQQQPQMPPEYTATDKAAQSLEEHPPPYSESG